MHSFPRSLMIWCPRTSTGKTYHVFGLSVITCHLTIALLYLLYFFTRCMLCTDVHIPAIRKRIRRCGKWMDETILRTCFSPLDSQFLDDVTNRGTKSVTKIRHFSEQPRLSWLRADTLYTHYIATMFWKHNLEMHPWSPPLCCPLESVCALARFYSLSMFYSRALETGQAPRLQMDTVELLWLKLFFLLTKGLRQLHVSEYGWQSIIHFHPHALEQTIVPFTIRNWVVIIFMSVVYHIMALSPNELAQSLWNLI